MSGIVIVISPNITKLIVLKSYYHRNIDHIEAVEAPVMERTAQHVQVSIEKVLEHEALQGVIDLEPDHYRCYHNIAL